MSKAKKQRITTQNLGCGGKDHIFVNEHLTRRNKQLFGAAIAKKQDVGWMYVLAKDGKILARQQDKSSVLRVTTLNYLDKMTAQAIVS